MTLQDLEYNSPVALGTMSDPVRADAVCFETAKGGGVLSVDSIAWWAALAHDGCDNNVSRINDNVLRRVASSEPL